MKCGSLLHGRQTIPLFLPEGEEEKTRGYDALPEGMFAGMLFLMGEEKKVIPVVRSRDELDVLWLDKGHVAAVCSIREGVIGAVGNAFLELPIGSAEEIGLHVGSRVEWHLDENEPNEIPS